jgi:hypothetical protein
MISCFPKQRPDCSIIVLFFQLRSEMLTLPIRLQKINDTTFLGWVIVFIFESVVSLILSFLASYLSQIYSIKTRENVKKMYRSFSPFRCAAYDISDTLMLNITSVLHIKWLIHSSTLIGTVCYRCYIEDPWLLDAKRSFCQIWVH